MSQVHKSQFTLISHTLCPYVQRAVIALEEQGLSYKRIDIDLSNKPAWFIKLSPLNKVPVLVVDDNIVLFESAVIAEYINDVGRSELLSRVSVNKARERAWIEFSSAILNNIGQLYNAKGEGDFLDVLKQLNSKWAVLEENLPEEGFFSGEHFSLVDAAFAPVFRYFDVFDKFYEFKLLDRYSKVMCWRKALRQRTSVLNAVSSGYSALLTQFVAVRDSYLGGVAKSYQLEEVIS